jgi:hypothetical protein
VARKIFLSAGLEDGIKDAYSLEFRGDENSVAETPRL